MYKPLFGVTALPNKACVAKGDKLEGYIAGNNTGLDQMASLNIF